MITETRTRDPGTSVLREPIAGVIRRSMGDTGFPECVPRAAMVRAKSESASSTTTSPEDANRRVVAAADSMVTCCVKSFSAAKSKYAKKENGKKCPPRLLTLTANSSVHRRVCRQSSIGTASFHSPQPTKSSRGNDFLCAPITATTHMLTLSRSSMPSLSKFIGKRDERSLSYDSHIIRHTRDERRETRDERREKSKKQELSVKQ